MTAEHVPGFGLTTALALRSHAPPDPSTVTAFRAVSFVPRSPDRVHRKFEIHDVGTPSSALARNWIRTSQETCQAWRKGRLYSVEKAGIIRPLSRGPIVQEADGTARRGEAQQLSSPPRLAGPGEIVKEEYMGWMSCNASFFR